MQPWDWSGLPTGGDEPKSPLSNESSSAKPIGEDAFQEDAVGEDTNYERAEIPTDQPPTPWIKYTVAALQVLTEEAPILTETSTDEGAASLLKWNSALNTMQSQLPDMVQDASLKCFFRKLFFPKLPDNEALSTEMLDKMIDLPRRPFRLAKWSWIIQTRHVPEIMDLLFLPQDFADEQAFFGQKLSLHHINYCIFVLKNLGYSKNPVYKELVSHRRRIEGDPKGAGTKLEGDGQLSFSCTHSKIAKARTILEDLLGLFTL
jgi:hypothetical protein